MVTGTHGYWSSKENRLKELKNFISKNGDLSKLLKCVDGKRLYHNFSKHEHKIVDAIIELGYDLESMNFSFKGMYNDFRLIENKINTFIDKNKRFPTQKEIIKTLKIDQRYIDKNGGIYGLKRKLKYFDESDLVDDRMFVNASMLEFIVAQFLIHHNIKYKRDSLIPNQNKQYRYDFYLLDYDIYVEVWGYQDVDGLITSEYNNIKKNKIKLYNDNNYKLISVEQSDIEIHNITHSIENLTQIFRRVFEINSTIPEEIFISNKSISDEEILGKIKEHSVGDVLPTLHKIKELDLGYLIRIIRKRHGSYYKFASKFGMYISGKEIDQSEIDIHFVNNFLLKIFNKHARDINRKDICSRKFGNGIIKWIEENGGMNTAKIKFYNQLICEGRTLPSDCVKFIFNIAFNQGINIKNYVTKEQMCEALYVLEKLQISHKKFIKELLLDMKRKDKWNNEDYVYEFNKTVKEGYQLTPKGFSDSTEYGGYKKYINHYKAKNWLKVIEIMNRFEDYHNYVLAEYENYVKRTGEYNLTKFVQQHEYIRTVDLMDYQTRDQWLSSINVEYRKKRYTHEDLKNNFITLKSQLGRVPLYSEFERDSNIPLATYASRYKFKGKVYDNIVKMYVSENEYNEYVLKKREHKTVTGRRNAGIII